MALLAAETQENVIELLLKEGLICRADFDTAKKIAAERNVSVLNVIGENKFVDGATIIHATAVATGVTFVNLENIRIEQEVLLNMPQDVAERNMAVPVAECKDGRLAIAMLDFGNIQAVDYLSTLTQKPVRVVAASEEGIRNAILQYKSDFSNVKKAVKTANAEAQEITIQDSNEKTITQDSPISKALNTILSYAAKSKASDIHIEPLEDALIIRCRVDGVLRQIMELPKSIEPALVSRIKILSNLKIDEHRIPQDGQFTVTVGEKEIDLRIAISPVVWGEQVVIRLLDKNGTAMEVEKMGMTGRALQDVLEGISKPNGMILTSGPTGSGKSTTLYALVAKIKSEAINIVTLEDPVEYKMGGVNQIQVNVDAGLTFASGLRSILRQDPDVVMVGEIRDAETANLAVQAALTGHLVFSTLHTNSAAGILPRLLDMGIEPFLIASTLNTVIGQRLVRRVSEKREARMSNEMETRAINESVASILPQSAEQVVAVSKKLGYAGLPVANDKGYTLVKGIETKDTPGGYSGRAGLYETIAVDEDIQKLVIAKATSADIMKVAKMKGTVTMRQDGILKALSGITTLEEVNRVASDLA